LRRSLLKQNSSRPFGCFHMILPETTLRRQTLPLSFNSGKSRLPKFPFSGHSSKHLASQQNRANTETYDQVCSINDAFTARLDEPKCFTDHRRHYTTTETPLQGFQRIGTFRQQHVRHWKNLDLNLAAFHKPPVFIYLLVQDNSLQQIGMTRDFGFPLRLGSRPCSVSGSAQPHADRRSRPLELRLPELSLFDAPAFWFQLGK